MLVLNMMGTSQFLVFLISFTAVTTYAISTTVEHIEEWNLWKEKYGKTYRDELEELHRYNIWQHKMTMVIEHNLQADKFGYTLAINEFSDLTDDEIATSLKGSNKMDVFMISNMTRFFEPSPNFRPLASLDWHARGAVTGAKNQRSCGACWAFSGTGAIEGQHFLKTGKLVSLSEQNLIDCSGKYGNNGCKGGNAYRAFKYVRSNGGIDTESSYPYEMQNSICRYSSQSIGATVNGFKWVHMGLNGNENTLLEAVTSVGPISVMIDSKHDKFYHYSGGVYYEPQCSSVKHDHEILVIGYGTQDGKDYWLIKNSWGNTWGINGFGLMARNMNNNCGIANYPSYPIV